MRVQFICKKNECYGFNSYTRRSSGLYNSTRFIVEALSAFGFHAEIIEIDDNNDIDREVTRFKPNLVIIEALWVVPEKFDVLKALHPKVQWFCHLHSNMPFLALEGIAMQWVNGYALRDVGMITNSTESYDALRCILTYDQICHLPNVYIGRPRRAAMLGAPELNVGCFGAVRPMKNQLQQALAAIQFANEVSLPLRFHVNASRLETGGDPILKNLVYLFRDTPNAELVECPWMEPDEFLTYLQNNIDIGMQVSMTETFNVVNADYVTAGIPTVVSKEIVWASRFNKTRDISISAITEVMHRVWKNRKLAWWNQRLLLWNSRDAQCAWFNFVIRERNRLMSQTQLKLQ